MHKKEIERLQAKVQQKGLTLVPLRLYFNERGRVKLELALARGKKNYDRRETIKKREAGRAIDRAMKESSPLLGSFLACQESWAIADDSATVSFDLLENIAVSSQVGLVPEDNGAGKRTLIATQGNIRIAISPLP